MLTKAQQLMVADGLPAELFLTREQRAAWWVANPHRTPSAPKPDQTELREQLKREQAALRIRKTPVSRKATDTRGKRWDSRLNKWIPIEAETRMINDDEKPASGDQATASTDPSQVASNEDIMSTTATATTAKKASAKKSVKSAKKANGTVKAKKANGTVKAKKANGNGAAKKRTPREGNKTQEVLAKLRKNGATRTQILEMTGWKAVSVQALVRAQGLNPDKDLKMSDDRPTTYRLTK